MNDEAMEILRALKSGQELLTAKVDGMEMRLSRVEGKLTDVEERLTSVEGRLTKVESELSIVKSDVRAIRERQEEQDKIVDILSARTTRLQAKLEA